MTITEVLNGPLFYNRQVRKPNVHVALLSSSNSSNSGTSGFTTASAPFTDRDEPVLLAASITKVAHFQIALQSQPAAAMSASLHRMLQALPQSWQAVAQQPFCPEPLWLRAQGLTAAAAPLVQQVNTSQLHSVSSSHQLAAAAALFLSTSSSVEVVSWDPARPWRGPSHSQIGAGCQLYLQGSSLGPQYFPLGLWGWAGQPAHQLVVKQASLRLCLIQSFAGKLRPGPGVTCRPRLLPVPGTNQTPDQVLSAVEARWVTSIQITGRGVTRSHADLNDDP